MFFRRKFSRRRIGRKVGGRRRGYGKRKVSKSVKTYVKKQIHRNVENKEIIVAAVNNAVTCAASTTPTGVPLIPAIAQGTADHQRIGNMIRCVKGVIRGRVNILPYNATTNPLSTPILVKMYLVRHLGIAGQVNMASLDWTNFFRGNGNAFGFTNSPQDLFNPINEDYWRLLGTKEFKIGAANATATGQVGSGGYFDNSPMSVPFYFNFGKKLRKMLKFSEGSSPSNYTTNDNCYLAVQVINADGSATATQPAEWHYCITFKYEDA